MLRIENLRVEVGGKEILKDVNLEIPPGETYVLFGPNGSGKTSLMMTIMGFAGYNVTRGKIVFKEQDITHMQIHERAMLGIGVSFQRPPTIHGLRTRSLLELCKKNPETDVDNLAASLNLTEFLDRDINENFSGGEIKRCELLQLMAQEPDLVLLDEPESGVDLVNMSLLGDSINRLLGRKLDAPKGECHKNVIKKRAKSALVITHTGHILDYITADKGQVLYDGFICCRRNAREILKWIQEFGYKECVQCTN